MLKQVTKGQSLETPRITWQPTALAEQVDRMERGVGAGPTPSVLENTAWCAPRYLQPLARALPSLQSRKVAIDATLGAAMGALMFTAAVEKSIYPAQDLTCLPLAAAGLLGAGTAAGMALIDWDARTQGAMHPRGASIFVPKPTQELTVFPAMPSLAALRAYYTHEYRRFPGWDPAVPRVVAQVIEETLFRGLLLPVLHVVANGILPSATTDLGSTVRANIAWQAARLGSSFVFGVGHLAAGNKNSWAHGVYCGLRGLQYADLTRNHGVFAPMYMHAVGNVLPALATVALALRNAYSAR